MAHENVLKPWEPAREAPDRWRTVRELRLGFAYWLAIVLVLEPGNIINAFHSGAPLAWDQEALRLTGAGVLGAAVTPGLLALIRRFPIEGEGRWRNAAIHLVGSVALAGTLIAVSCVLASWMLVAERRPLAAALRDQITANGPLLVFGFGAFVAIAHFRRARGELQPQPPETPYLRRIPVKTRTGLVMVETADIDWIETQGNYLALHVGSQAHLIRDTSKRFEAKLDPGQFTRAHRQIIVAVDSIGAMSPLGSGDASIRLKDGTTLRVSRGFRARVRARLCG
jgi:two-component system LytT family response regulator